MGTLYYGDGRRPIVLEDRTLAHVKTIIVSKLRRGEAFAMNWDKSVSDGSGRHTIWLNPAIVIEFEFDGSIPPTLNRVWLELLADSAASNQGLRVIPEPLEISASS